MPFYNDLRPEADFDDRDIERVVPDMPAHEKLRTIDGLIALRALLRGQVSARRTESNLLVASWNIQNLGHGTRHAEALYYIAEVLSAFDLIAVQELTTNLKDLDRIMRILGPNWKYIYNDPAREQGSNDESSAFIYNTDRVHPTGLSGELSVWTDDMADALAGNIDDDIKALTRFAAKRPPHIVGFTTGWKSFSLTNVHLEPSTGRKPRTLRQKEIALVLAALKKNEALDWAARTILVGDMNFYKGQDEPTIDLLHASGFWESGALVGQTTNVPNRDEHGDLFDGHIFDRMFLSERDYFRIAEDILPDGTIRQRGGVVPVFDAVMREDDWPIYHQDIIEKQRTAAKRETIRTDPAAAKTYFSKYWRKGQVSDHLPIWIELQTDDTADFLSDKRAEILAETPMG